MAGWRRAFARGRLNVMRASKDRVAETLVARWAGGGEGVGDHGEQLLQPGAGGPPTLLGGRDRDAEEGRDLRVREACEVVERDDAPLALGQPLHRGAHLRRLGRHDGEVFRPRARVDDGHRLERHGLRPDAAGTAACSGADQAKQPSGERHRVVERAHVSEREDERLLSDVLRLVEITAQAHRGGDGEVLEPVDERHPRAGVATLDSSHESGPAVTVLCERHHRRGASPIVAGYRELRRSIAIHADPATGTDRVGGRHSVDLPAPDGPMRAVIVAGGARRQGSNWRLSAAGPRTGLSDARRGASSVSARSSASVVRCGARPPREEGC
jgi:hypothetical protein